MIIRVQNKASKYPLSKYKGGWGYFVRARFFRQYGIVLHTTNGKKGTRYEDEVKYLLNSPDVSAHYIISKEGIITQLLPIEYSAWHAGRVNDNQYGNNDSIGIEMHYTPGEKIHKMQIEACHDLCKLLRTQYSIKDVKMHRTIAVFKDGRLGRKIDPSNLTDIQFEILRNRIMSDPRIIKSGAQIFTDKELTRKAAHINTDTIDNGRVLQDTLFEVVDVGISYWMVNGFGFINKLMVI